jgi:two-component system phosphate regulon response regulator PhoB
MKAKVFLVEDEQSIVTLVEYSLKSEGYKVLVSSNGEEALSEIKKEEPDIVLLDWMLPDLSGLDICKLLKKDEKFKHIPIIMLTAKGQEEDKVAALNAGADDYITKPFGNAEMVARINALLRRSKPGVVSDKISYEDIVIDRLQRKVFRKKIEINMGPSEYKILDFLIKNPKRVYSRDQLLNNIWPDNINVEIRTVDVHITRLRKAINIEGTKELIRTVRSAGYSLD